MFCSKCGRTIPQGSAVCLNCGLEIAGGEFSAESYIGMQPVLNKDGSAPEAKPRHTKFTRTSYTTMAPEDESDVFRRTTYRPAYQEPEEEPVQEEEEQLEGQSAPEEAAQEAAQEEKPAEPEPIKADPESLPENLRARPLRKVTLGGISPQMAERMRLQEEQERAKAAGEKKPARPVVPGLFSAIGRGAKSLVPKREVYEEPEEEYQDDENAAETYEENYDENYDGVYEEDEVFDTSDIEEEEPASRPALFSFRRPTAPASRSTVIIRSVIAAVVILALCMGGFIWLSLKTAARSPIAGVTYALYEQGIAMLEEHTTPVYKKSMSDLYAEDPTGASVLTKQTADQAAMMALLPGTPLANDEDFMDTLMSIQSTIDIAVTLDAMSGEALDKSASDARWKAIDNAIKRLKAANSATEFGSISASAVVSATPTPAPTPTVSPYSTLTKGMSDNEEVKKMQNRLYELGWFTDVRDGDFGALTQTAVKQFQQACGLSVTGIADPETLEAIYADDAPRTGAKVTPAPTPDDGSVAGEAIETPAPAAPAQ